MSEFAPLRSVLYMPSSNERALEKAKTIACDALILDLEDAVAPDAKPAAWEAAAAAAASGDLGVRGDGVLEVEDERVGGQRPRLLERAGVGRRHVEDRAPGPQAVCGAHSAYASASPGSRAASCRASSSTTVHCL